MDNSHRQLHGALLDAQLLADVYIALTSGQERNRLRRPTGRAPQVEVMQLPRRPVGRRGRACMVATDELAAHEARLEKLRKKAGKAVWDAVRSGEEPRDGARLIRD